MKDERTIGAAQRLHYFFSVLYGVLAAIIVSASIFGINYEITFQTGLLGFDVGIAFLLIASTAISRRTQRRTSEYLIYRDCAIAIATTCAISIIFTSFYLYNVVYILAVKCPEFQNGHVAPHVELLLVSYIYPHKSISKQNVLLLRYNATERSLSRRKQIDHQWFAASDRYQHQKSAYDVLMALPEAERRTVTAFHFLEQEVQLLLGENLRAMGVEEERGFSAQQHEHGGEGANREEERIFLELKARRICRNEYAFAVFWAVFLSLLILFNLLTIGVYSWIKY